MTPSFMSIKFSRWFRSLAGGLISALVAEIGVLLSFRIDSLFWSGFYLPILVFDPGVYEIRILTILVFWFVVGLLVTYLTRRNLAALGTWLILYILFLVIGVVRIFTA